MQHQNITHSKLAEGSVRTLRPQEELALLRSRYAQVLDDRRAVIFIAGEPGIGKTAVVQAFLDSII